MRKMIALFVLVVMATVAMAGVNPVRLNWNNVTNLDTMASGKSLLGARILSGTKACTTATVTWWNVPYGALAWNGYVQTLRDSGYCTVLFKWSNSRSFDDRVDTVLSGCVIFGNDDTLRSQARHWTEEYYPRTSYSGYFIFQGTGDNSDSTRIDSLFWLPDPNN